MVWIVLQTMGFPFNIYKLKNKFIKIAFIGLIGGFLIVTLFLILHQLTLSLENSKRIANTLLMDTLLYGHNGSLKMTTDNTLASLLHKKVRVLCWVMTAPHNHKKRAIHVKRTWGKRCNYLVFMSTRADLDLPAVELPVKEGRKMLWQKTREAFRYVYLHYRDKAEWFLKADDDTYVVMENLRYMLLQHNPEEPIYFGCKFNRYVKQGYMSGGAGYVLSKEALTRFVKFVESSSKQQHMF